MMRDSLNFLSSILATLLLVATASAQPASEEYAAQRLEAVVKYLDGDDNDSDFQYAALPYLTEFLEENGAEGLKPELRETTYRFVVRWLEALRQDLVESESVRAGIAIRLTRWFPDETVRDLLYETLELNFERVPRKPELFDALRVIGMTETLPHFQDLLDEFGALEPEEYRRAAYPYPIREAFDCAAVLGGDDEAHRIAPFLRVGVPDSIQVRAFAALATMGGEKAHAILSGVDTESASPVARWALGDALCALDDPAGARVLLALIQESNNVQAWSSLRLAAGRALPAAADAEAWVAGLSASLRASRLEAVRAAGYDIGELTTREQHRALLDAAADDAEFVRRTAWDEIVRILGDDPSDGLFWTYRDRLRGRDVDMRVRPAAKLTEEAAVKLHGRQTAFLAGVREAWE